ncbi:MAG: class I SAM-dependent methyltransferase [Dehalococcoidia bacterium]|nr:class I SAM-dependent methyltransferase [Dehalococcoidia bacterium]
MRLPGRLPLLVSAVVGPVSFWLLLRYRLRRPCSLRLRFLLENPVRRAVHPVGPTVDKFRIRKGGTVLELGPGSGYFTAEAASRVGERGRLICIDILPETARFLSQRFQRQGIDNSRILVGDACNLPLKERMLDGAFLVTVLGETTDKQRAIGELRRAMKPGGVLSITESLPDPDYQTQATVRRLCEGAGFQWTELYRRPGGFTMNFVALTEWAGSAPTRSS